MNLWVWGILKEISYEPIRSALEKVRQVSLEVINLWELPYIPKRSELFETLLELLSVFMFDADMKPGISDMLVPSDEFILLELWCIVDLMAADDLLCKLEMDDLVFYE